MLSDHDYMDIAREEIAVNSPDPSTKVGCLIVDERLKGLSDAGIISHGHNDFPDGVQNLNSRWENRELKYKIVVHAEVNAILNTDVKGKTAYVTHHPCSNCTAAMIQAGIRRIVTREPEPDFETRWEESMRISKMMCEEAGVELTLLD